MIQLRTEWKSCLSTPETVLNKIKPGMSIFLSTGVAEPRTMIRHIMTSASKDLEDLELIQLVSFGDAISLEALKSKNFRLKTFFSGWAADKAIQEGLIDLVPSRFGKIRELISAGQIPLDMAVVQVTPPNEAGYCSLGVAVDVAWEAIEKAPIKVGEVNLQIPITLGDTFIPASYFDYLVLSEEPPIYFDRWPVDEIMDKVAFNAATLVEDGSCLAFSVGPLYEALGRHLKSKKHLGVHSPLFTDPLMDLVQIGAVTNRRKESYRGKSLTSYAFGTPELFRWLNNNPLIEFQRVDKVFSPQIIGRNRKFITIVGVRKIDLYGRIALYAGKGNIATGPAEVLDFLAGASLSEGGRSIFALTSRDPKGNPNILPAIGDWPNQFNMAESIGTVVTEHGIAFLEGRTVRERAQALIEVAHPDDRGKLVDEAKKRNIIYPDQVFLAESARLYPEEISFTQTFKGDIRVHFRPIKPSDEEGMRHLFYRLTSDCSYYRYFRPVRSMPHAQMQEYANVDWSRDMSLVGLVGEEGKNNIVAEARYLSTPGTMFAEVVFVVDESYQSLGIATYLYGILIRLARERGLQGFTADVLFDNQAMMKVFRKGDFQVNAKLESGVYHLTVPFKQQGVE